ncbi:paired mesoderm homeobox protein 2B-like [Lineus longissimus]|uniref:paired mesoderm homeobox protein 2B-like n=1 Tax=Lineus longissimus TaxID=88925 RepID=UPI00315D778B
MFQGGQNLFLPNLYYLYAANMPFSNESGISVWPTSSNLVAEDLSTRSKHQVRCRLNLMDTFSMKNQQRNSPKPAKTGFSIADILKKDSETVDMETDGEMMKKIYHRIDEERLCNSLADFSQEDGDFSWLQCTRYKPPKLPRLKKKEGVKKRKLGRNPRVPFTQHQVNTLEQKFRRTHYLSSLDVAELSSALNLTETRVKIWFQNRRARERRERDGKGTSVAKSASFSKNSENSNTDDCSSASSSDGNGKGEDGGRLSWYTPIPPPTSAMAQFNNAVQNGTSAFSPVSLTMT